MSETVAPRAYRNPNWRTDNAELESALDAFWNVAYTQGHEQRGHDDEAGTAQKAEDELRRVIANRDSIKQAEDLYEIAEALGCECDAQAIVKAVADLKGRVSFYRMELAATVREGISAVANARQSPSTAS